MNPVVGLEGGGGGRYMCSNVDQMCIVISQSPPIPPGMLDSHIIGAVNSGLRCAMALKLQNLDPKP